MLKSWAKKNPMIMRMYASFLAVRKELGTDQQEAAVKAQFEEFKKLSAKGEQRFDLSWKDRLVVTTEATEDTGFDRHYVYHPSWAARVLAQTKPTEHIDISSTLFFIGIASAFVPVKFYDYRPADLILSNLSSGKADLTNLPFDDNSVESISCMHVIEHIGLGRYGDPLDPDGDITAMKELMRVTKPGGDLLFVTPLAGKPRLAFNGHRIYSRDQILSYFNGMKLMEFTLIPEDGADGGLVTDPSDALLAKQGFGCGCFWFRKPE